MGCRLASVFLLVASIRAGQKFEVKIVNRQTGETGYSYVVPGSARTNGDVNVNCNGTTNTVNCSGTSTSTTTSVPAQEISYSVTGATFTLQLPDGRLAVVNCESKFNWTDFSKPNQIRRSCKIPLVDIIQAEFDGDKALLKWPVSIDGKKTQSETYKILAVLDKR
jgi:hypothetical protein